MKAGINIVFEVLSGQNVTQHKTDTALYAIHLTGARGRQPRRTLLRRQKDQDLVDQRRLATSVLVSLQDLYRIGVHARLPRVSSCRLERRTGPRWRVQLLRELNTPHGPGRAEKRLRSCLEPVP